MTPDERQLITGLFDRLRQTGLPEKDREADQLIRDYLRQMPDATYMLVQSVIVQEMALNEAQARVDELEHRVRQLERLQPQQSSGGSFLGGLFGGGGATQRPSGGSVPATGRQSAGFGQGASAPMRSSSPWGQQSAPPMGGQTMASGGGGGGGGGFIRSAMATAAGVAGGMLAANAIQNMLGGGSAHAASTSGGLFGDNASSAGNRSDAGYGSQSQNLTDENNDPGNYDDSNDPGTYDDGGDSGGWGGGDE
jgi:hypothetical protein